jgi:hypothetical protein
VYCLHEGNYYTHNKPRVKQQKDWCGKKDHHETPATHAASETEALAETRTLDGHSYALKHKVEGRETITSASRQGDCQVVNQSGCNEYHKASRDRSDGAMQGAKDQFMGKLTEPKIPPFAPKLSEGYRAEWGRHNRFGLNAHALPQQTNDLEGAEVQQQDQTQHSDPPA